MENNVDKLNLLKEFYIPTYIFVPESPVEHVSQIPSCPVIVFVNTKSGGQLGRDLIITYRNLLNRAQVFDLLEESPDKVLHRLYSNLEKLKHDGDTLASEIYRRLRLIVAGGDGTAGWLLGVVSDLKLSHPPPVATVPLGTGNNLPYSFGWGKRNPGTDHESVLSFLQSVREAKEMNIDSWHIVMRMESPKGSACDPIPPSDLPHSLHAFHRVPKTDPQDMEYSYTFRGGFWNYFSMGMDAQVSYAFHSDRKLHPEKFQDQLSNQKTYLKLACTQGWFCANMRHPMSRNIAHLAKVKIMKKSGKWEDLEIPRSIRSIVCLNLPSFSGGLNPWGTPSKRKQRKRDLVMPPLVDDGLLEIVGFKDAWHGLVLLTPKGHGTRLAQAHRVRFEFHKGATTDHAYMRMDGEPWKQPLPVDDGKVVVEISHAGQVKMLATKNCIAKGIHEASPDSDEGRPSPAQRRLQLSVLRGRRRRGGRLHAVGALRRHPAPWRPHRGRPLPPCGEREASGHLPAGEDPSDQAPFHGTSNRAAGCHPNTSLQSSRRRRLQWDMIQLVCDIPIEGTRGYCMKVGSFLSIMVSSHIVGILDEKMVGVTSLLIAESSKWHPDNTIL